ncbi:carbon-nitrogen hydrolase family protein [Amycolatopsis acidicola]|uniref:Carbon-nitrogen hydrolase family protein n=1 Tax=Amycolatopsis acidicola TaxID=2596893 RepID=A0A5N0UQB1_9PSEU|nr:carbon-nitrogen hydrolase family protein [Amycolatopsis acidicola]KAA9150725.1 carbon-nitrogen hydrolase family protein [Amycolatopsis acidicola]
MPVTIATVALKGTHDLELSVKNHLGHLEEAAAQGADLVVFPEISLQGYPSRGLTTIDPADIAEAQRTAESVPDGPNVRAVLDRAAELGVHVIFGVTELGDAAGALYNTAVLGGPEGFIGKYRKVHVAITEQVTWRRGDDWPVFDTALGRIGMLICYDKMWPESCRELTLRGADLLVMPTAWPMVHGEQDAATNPFAELYRLYDRARAAENSRWFVSSNYGGELGGAEFVGLSQIVDPGGNVVATTGDRTPGMAIATVDVKGGIAAANAALFGARLIRDRRPDTYRAATGEVPTAIDA